MYIVELFFSLKDGFLTFIGASEQFPSWELWQNDMQFKFVNNFFQLFMEILELAIP